MMELPKGTNSERILAYLALTENRPNLQRKPDMWDALRGNHVACLLFSVFVKALGRASVRTLMCRHATPFLRPVAVAL